MCIELQKIPRYIRELWELAIARDQFPTWPLGVVSWSMENYLCNDVSSSSWHLFNEAKLFHVMLAMKWNSVYWMEGIFAGKKNDQIQLISELTKVLLGRQEVNTKVWILQKTAVYNTEQSREVGNKWIFKFLVKNDLINKLSPE